MYVLLKNLLLILTFVFSVFQAIAVEEPASRINNADSIMRLVITNARDYEKKVSQYEAKVYVKGKTDIHKKNALIIFAHNLFPVSRNDEKMVFELVSHFKHKAPNMYQHHIEAINSNSRLNRKKRQEVLSVMNINAYSSTIYEDDIITPLVPKSFKYYNFKILDTKTSEGRKIYSISFTPKQNSQRLVTGTLNVTDSAWTIDGMSISGRYRFADFMLNMSFNSEPDKFILPESADLKVYFNVLGNKVETNYNLHYDYTSIELDENNIVASKRGALDLTNYFSLSDMDIPIVKDSSYWEKNRHTPLSPEEKAAYITNEEKDTTAAPSTINYLKITEDVTQSIHWDYKGTQMNYSGILNPFQLGYSQLNGVTYKQKIRFNRKLKNEQELRLYPEAGYIFKRKEFFAKMAGDWLYKPEKIGYLSFSAGNTYQSYSSEIMDEIKNHARDSAFNFDKINISYFKTYFAELKNNIELFHGFQASFGISYYHRAPAKRPAAREATDIEDLINKSYNDFMPTINLSYTPRQYYRMDGRKKMYIRSYFPTFSVELAKAIPNVFNSNGNYFRVEANIQQKIAVGLTRKFGYNFGGGMYTNQSSTYFADFKYFARNYFPETWEEQFGGSFQLLRREWYNASNKYLQGHAMYESPFILIQALNNKSLSRYVLKERFYVNHLWTPVMPSYTEFGYGIGNNIFNIAAFVSFKKYEQQNVGLRFAFELFQ